MERPVTIFTVMAKATKNNVTGVMDNKKRTTTYLSESKIRSVKYIAFTDETSIVDIFDDALTEYIKRWEAKNGPIPQKK